MRGRKTIVLAGALSVLIGSMGFAWGGDPPGNNGTVKVDGLSGDKGNDPHVGCVVAVNFYGFDEGPLMGTATFSLIPPTGKEFLTQDSTFIGEDPAGGANDLDASLIEPLSGWIAQTGVSPQEQGFHVEVTVHADGSIGADVKHKTFWVDAGCGGEGGDGGGD